MSSHSLGNGYVEGCFLLYTIRKNALAASQGTGAAPVRGRTQDMGTLRVHMLGHLENLVELVIQSRLAAGGLHRPRQRGNKRKYCNPWSLHDDLDIRQPREQGNEPNSPAGYHI